MAKHTEPKVSSLAEMKATASPIVQLPSWDGETEINVRLKRVTLFSMIQAGQIPNDLLATAYKAAGKEQGTGSPIDQSNPEEVKKFTQLMHEVAKASLVEPTYEEIQENVGDLTDQQLMAIFFYCLAGVRALNNFRKSTRALTTIRDSGEDVQLQTE